MDKVTPDEPLKGEEKAETGFISTLFHWDAIHNIFWMMKKLREQKLSEVKRKEKK